MFFNLSDAIASLNQQGTVFALANAARPGNGSIFAAILPEQPRQEYFASAANMTIRTTMAGMVGMDSAYPPGGAVETRAFNEQTVKIANEIRLPEQQLRELQYLLAQLSLRSGNTSQAITQTALNFLNKLIIQAHLDTAEWLRGQALTLGKIDWTFNGKRLLVDYGLPAENFVTARTGNDGYGGSSSKFWTDLRTGRKLLNQSVRAWIMSPNTKEMILANSANNFKLLAETDTTFSGVRYTSVAGNTVESTDPRDRAQFITYNAEGEVWDPANPGKTLKLPFMPDGVILGVGNNQANRFIVGSGATNPPGTQLVPQNAVGYTHLAPTVESGGQPGRFARLYTPEAELFTFVGQGVSNLLPVIEAPEKLVILTTEMV